MGAKILEVNEASDGSEAAQIFDEEDRFDLVVSDLIMPGADGLDLLDHTSFTNDSLIYSFLSH